MAASKLLYFNRHRLLYIRLKHGLTQDQMAALVEITRSQYCRYEYGDLRRMHESKILLWADHFGLDVTYFLQNYTEAQLLKIEEAAEAVREAKAVVKKGLHIGELDFAKQEVYTNALKHLDMEIKLASASLYSGEDKISRHEEKKEEDTLTAHVKNTIRDVLNE